MCPSLAAPRKEIPHPPLFAAPDTSVSNKSSTGSPDAHSVSDPTLRVEMKRAATVRKNAHPPSSGNISSSRPPRRAVGLRRPD
ncbi:hypothetical protein Q5P01_024157 [Channa striata]|uniref:Uncharacterized protein n=1 Tax=Channa striata TaxID=64152 RepID=A0AA88IR49_CHASR|nr:hypothetical protein Q5P01_024157 [Channa striata]